MARRTFAHLFRHVNRALVQDSRLLLGFWDAINMLAGIVQEGIIVAMTEALVPKDTFSSYTEVSEHEIVSSSINTGIGEDRVKESIFSGLGMGRGRRLCLGVTREEEEFGVTKTAGVDAGNGDVVG
jgi:hypothetical protein